MRALSLVAAALAISTQSALAQANMEALYAEAIDSKKSIRQHILVCLKDRNYALAYDFYTILIMSAHRDSNALLEARERIDAAAVLEKGGYFVEASQEAETAYNLASERMAVATIKLGIPLDTTSAALKNEALAIAMRAHERSKQVAAAGLPQKVLPVKKKP